ncbi:MAG: CHAD domain-containing protein [Actinomycetes bacterium]
MNVSDFVTGTFQSSIRIMVHTAESARNPKDVEALHDFRVGLRKLRSHIRSFESVLGPKWVGHQKDRLEWLDSYLRPVRDGDVLIARLQSDVSEMHEELDQEAVRSLKLSLAVKGQRDRARLKLAMDSQIFAELMEDLNSWNSNIISFRKEPRVLENWLKELGRQSRKEIFSIASNISDSSSDHELHKLRIKSKRARYLAEASVPVLGQKAKKRAKEYESIQTLLGGYQDSFVMSQWLDAQSRLGSEHVAAVTQILDWEHACRATLRVGWLTLWSGIENGISENSE